MSDQEIFNLARKAFKASGKAPEEKRVRIAKPRNHSLRGVFIVVAAILVAGVVTTGLLYVKETTTVAQFHEPQVADAAQEITQEQAEYQQVQEEAVKKTVAAASTQNNEALVVQIATKDSDYDGLLDWQESRFGTDPANADTDNDSYNDGTEIKNGYDPTGEGRPGTYIHVDSVGINAEVKFAASGSDKDMQRAMEFGPTHYPGTSMPGTNGNIYITGHSSDYTWRPGVAKTVFRPLKDAQIGDMVEIEQILDSGKTVTFTYQIYDIQVKNNDDPSLWVADREGSVLTLVTSWPIGATSHRLMVRGILVD